MSFGERAEPSHHPCLAYLSVDYTQPHASVATAAGAGVNASSFTSTKGNSERTDRSCCKPKGKDYIIANSMLHACRRCMCVGVGGQGQRRLHRKAG